MWTICDHWLQNCDHKDNKSLIRDKIPHLLARPLRDTAAQMFMKVKIFAASYFLQITKLRNKHDRHEPG